MAPFSLLLAVATALLASVAAAAAAAAAAPIKWQLAETYDVSNFFEKFDFFTERSGDAGYARFQSKPEAFRKGLVAYRRDHVYIGTDHNSVLKGACELGGSIPGRDSVRIESKSRYNHGLLIARFTHLPPPQCGLWPAFWMYGDEWPKNGEIDILQTYNVKTWNEPSFRVSDAPDLGQCRMSNEGQSAYVNSADV
ncbi:hypothetical protein CDD83_6872 [Cordyceps sp. RAO-2017]|nr:hypothetical protein CDD83_6872 [Cordyceps sp. RAO-2017]